MSKFGTLCNDTRPVPDPIGTAIIHLSDHGQSDAHPIDRDFPLGGPWSTAWFRELVYARDVIFMRELLCELGVLLDGPSPIYCDSKSAVGMAFDPVAFKKTKHVLRVCRVPGQVAIAPLIGGGGREKEKEPGGAHYLVLQSSR